MLMWRRYELERAFVFVILIRQLLACFSFFIVSLIRCMLNKCSETWLLRSIWYLKIEAWQMLRNSFSMRFFIDYVRALNLARLPLMQILIRIWSLKALSNMVIWLDYCCSRLHHLLDINKTLTLVWKYSMLLPVPFV